MFLTPFLKLFNYLITLHCKWYLLQKKIFKKDIFLKSLHSVAASYVPFVIFEFGIFFHLYPISTNSKTPSSVSLHIILIIPEKNQPRQEAPDPGKVLRKATHRKVISDYRKSLIYS